MEIEDPKQEVYNGQEVEVWPRIVWSPSWALTFAEVCKKLSGLIKISQRSTLVIDGRDISLKDVTLDGTLVLRSNPDAQVRTFLEPSYLSIQFVETPVEETLLHGPLKEQGCVYMGYTTISVSDGVFFFNIILYLACRQGCHMCLCRTGVGNSGLWVTETRHSQR